MKRAVVDLQSTRAVWRAPAASILRITRAFGRGWEVVEVRAPSSSDGDGAEPSQEALEAVQGAEVYVGWGVSADIVRSAGPNLVWAHTAAAGVGASLTPGLLSAGVTLTNSRGTHAEPMGDWAVAAVTFCVRGFHVAVAAQRARSWSKEAYADGSVTLREFADTRVGIVGLGGVGSAIARRCHALGMHVRGVRRDPKRRKPPGVSWVGAPNALPKLATRTDVLVIAAPQTDATTHIVDDKVLRALPSQSWVVNLARGELLDERALLRHLDKGRLAGAVLDVLATEPLPRKHPFWRHERILITPHISGVTDRFWPRETGLIVENVRRYRKGRHLKNIVNPEVGY